MTLPHLLPTPCCGAVAAERRTGARRCRSICPTRWALSSKPAAPPERWDRQTDGRTPDSYTDPVLRAGSINLEKKLYLTIIT